MTTNQDALWMQRARRAVRWLEPLAFTRHTPPRIRSRAGFDLWCLAVRSHRYCWLRNWIRP